MVAKLIGTTGLVCNMLCTVGSGAGLVIGFLFFLINFGDKSRRTRTLRGMIVSKDNLMIIGTMTSALIYFLLVSRSTTMIGNEVFPGLLGAPIIEHSGAQLLTAGMLQAIWTMLCLYWLLPNVLGFGRLGRKIELSALLSAGLCILYGVLSI
ncbi:hypothetical protein KQI74_12010 [Paenibacillus barcinonensis]|uniref:hypothetical protein n=1 Tax=Paenibacillus barcinonensis TaxID=198119 RepID=UPI001C1102BA|nr:hypothetical protein [Paenibacillus barcinonensis]MBU5353015.1 hypothetical protein [Paenibacillus barcinonensis]